MARHVFNSVGHPSSYEEGFGPSHGEGRWHVFNPVSHLSSYEEGFGPSHGEGRMVPMDHPSSYGEGRRFPGGSLPVVLGQCRSWHTRATRIKIRVCTGCVINVSCIIISECCVAGRQYAHVPSLFKIDEARPEPQV